MKNEMMETNQTGFLALQDFDLADVMCAEMDGLSAAFERVKIPSGGGVMFDGHHGEGNPGGSCDSCPLNQYGSGKNGAKACKNRRRLYLLREGDIFPVILSLPTGSLKSFTRYLMRVIPKYKNSNAVVTKFTLKKAVSGTGMSYSQAQFAVERALSPEEYPLIAAVTEQVKALSKNVGYDAEDALCVDSETGEVIEPLN